ncbi:MAG: type II secretion system F family protein [Candidatus Adiutrix sp.]|jgi:tight adherence protein C|nr:type II secretion system F family protein [Candidatus Adiutrix sp.]
MDIFVFMIPLAGLALALYLIQGRVRETRLLRRLKSLGGRDDGRLGQETGAWPTLLHALAVPLANLKERDRLRQSLLKAGYRAKWAVDVFLLAKLALFAVGAAGAWLFFDLALGSLFARPLNSAKFLFCVFIAARAADWWLSAQVQRRRARIRVAVPQTIDLLTICVEAGASLEDAFGRVGAEVASRSPEIASEFRLTRSEMMVMDRAEALRRMERRSDVREIGSLASSLLQSIHYGTPLAEALSAIATESRARQVGELEEKAGNIAAKVGVPLIVLVLFPLLILIAAPAVINLVRILGER